MRRENQRYQYLVRGTVKAYKGMTASSAQAANALLARQGSEARWVVCAEPQKTQVAALPVRD